MGDAKNDDLRVSFDSRLKLKFLGSKVTTDAGLLAYRELDEALGLTEMADDLLGDSRLGSNKQHRLLPLLRQSIYSRLAGYEDVNDAERLSVDPAMRQVVGGRAALTDKHAASAKAESSGTASSWAALVKRVFEVDPLECPQCGSRMNLMGDCQDKDLRVHFDRRLKVKFLGSQVRDGRLSARVCPVQT